MSCFLDPGGSTSNPTGSMFDDGPSTSGIGRKVVKDDDDICIVYENIQKTRAQKPNKNVTVSTSPSSQSKQGEEKVTKDESDDCILVQGPDKIKADQKKSNGSKLPPGKTGKKSKIMNELKDKDEQKMKNNDEKLKDKDEEKEKDKDANTKNKDEQKQNDSTTASSASKQLEKDENMDEIDDCIIIKGPDKPKTDKGKNKSKDSKLPELKSGKKLNSNNEGQDDNILFPVQFPRKDKDVCIVKPSPKVINPETVKKTLAEINFLKEKHKIMKESFKKTADSKVTNTQEALGSSTDGSATSNKDTDTGEGGENNKKGKTNGTHLRLSAKELADLKFPDYTPCKKRRTMPKSALTAENTSETLSMDATSPSPGNEVNAECTETDGVLALTRCVLSHLHKESAEFESAAEQLLSSLHLLLQSLSIRHDANKEEMNTHTEEPGSFHKEASSEKQDLVAYLHSILKDCSQPGESQKKCGYSFNDCTKRVRCFKIALEWLFSHIHSNLEPHLLRIFKNTIKGLEVTAKHLESLQKQDGLVIDAHAESDDLDPLLLATQSLELNSSSNGSTDHSEMASIKMVSVGDGKSSVTETGPHSFLTKLCATWNSQSKISPNAEKSTTSNPSVSALTHNSTKVSVNVTDDPSVESRRPESFSSHVMSTEPSNIMISNDDSNISSSDETDRLIILSLPENSESFVSSKERANLLDILSIKDPSNASTSDDTNQCLEEETNHLLPESTSSKTDTIELSVMNTVGPNVNFISVNAAIPQEEGVKQAEPVPPCSITQTDVVQIAGEDASISIPANSTEETTLSGKTSSLSQLPCKNQTSKRTQRKHAVWRVSIPSDEMNENINLLPEVRQTRSQAMKKANDSLKIIIHKVTDAEGSSSIEDNCSPCTERNPRKRRRKSSKVKVLQTSESTGEESSCLPSVQQAPLISHLWKKHKVSHKNTSQDCDKAQAVNLNESSVINGQPESQPPDTSANSECQEKTVDVNELQSPLDLSPKQSLEMSSERSQRSITSSVLVNSIEEKNEIPQAIVGTQNENEAEVNVFSQSQSYNPSVTPVSPPSAVMETEISSNQFTQPNISVQDALVEFNFPLENTVLPQSIYNTNIPYEGEVPRITSAENQLSLQQTEGGASQIALSSVNQHYCLQPFTTAGTSYRESNRNGINDKSNNLSLVQYYGGQLPHLQETVAAPRSDETTYNCGTFNGVHAVPNNMNVMSPNNIQGVSHFSPLVQRPTFDGVRIPSNGPAEQGPSASNRREAHHLNNQTKVEQPPLNLGNMVDLAFSSGMLIPHSALSLYGRQRLEICGSRAPEIMGPSEAEQTPHTLTLADLALASGALIPRNSPPLLYGRQRQICAPETMDSSIIGHRPHIMGAAFATDTENAAQTPVNEVLTPYERYVREMDVSSVNQAPANMYAMQGPSLATVPSQSHYNERQMPENINSTPQQGNRRQRRPTGTTAPRGRKRPQRVTGALNIAHENNELREAQRMTVPNAGHIPGNMMNLNAGTSNMGYRNIHPAQQFNHISAEGAIAHAPYNYFGGNTGLRPPALQRPLSRGQISFPRGHLSPLPNLRHRYWYSQPQSAWNNQGQMGFLQPSPASYLHNNQRNQSSQNPRVQQTRN